MELDEYELRQLGRRGCLDELLTWPRHQVSSVCLRLGLKDKWGDSRADLATHLTAHLFPSSPHATEAPVITQERLF